MRGWEAFARVDAGGVDDLVVRPLDGDLDWDAGEITNGVAGVLVSLYGDEPYAAFIAVAGVDEAAVRAAFHRAADLVMSAAGARVLGCG